MGFLQQVKRFLTSVLVLLTACLAVGFAAPVAERDIDSKRSSGLGIIKGVVRDDRDIPIAGATVAIFRNGTSRLLKQVSSARDGSFIAKVMPGTYTVIAVAEGFNPVTLFGVEVARSAELSYGFKLERAGAGNTLPEKRLDRNNSKWRIRAAQLQRSIYQNREGDAPIEDDQPDGEQTASSTEPAAKRKSQTVVETYFAGNSRGNYSGLNFAAFLPIRNDAEIVFAGQTAKGRNAPLRFETTLKYRPLSKHQIRLTTSVGKLGNFVSSGVEKMLGQLSLQATDEWQFRDGVILVFGLDYTRFIGASDDSSISPRLGLQLDVNSKTRLRTAFTSQTEAKSWANAIDFEGQRVAFTEPVAIEDLVIISEKPRINKSRRLEFGVERILSDKSSLDLSLFFDTTYGRGLSFNTLAVDDLAEGFADLIANQQGDALGARAVYTRRINNIFSASAGYSFGNGHQLSSTAFADPTRIFEESFFHTFFGEVTADLRTGTSFRTIYRLSPQATVFAIDPFKGRLAIYDPGLSIFVMQHLPNLGLPFTARAILDARNLLDAQTGINGEDTSLVLNAQRRMLRGGIQFRF